MAIARTYGVEVARRVITRSAEAKGEDAHGVSEAQFQAMREAGAFAWIGRPMSIAMAFLYRSTSWLDAGKSVLINGSRGHLAAARRRYPDLLAVGLAVSPRALRERLLARG